MPATEKTRLDRCEEELDLSIKRAELDEILGQEGDIDEQRADILGRLGRVLQCPGGELFDAANFDNASTVIELRAELDERRQRLLESLCRRDTTKSANQAAYMCLLGEGGPFTVSIHIPAGNGIREVRIDDMPVGVTPEDFLNHLSRQCEDRGRPQMESDEEREAFRTLLRHWGLQFAEAIVRLARVKDKVLTELLHTHGTKEAYDLILPYAGALELAERIFLKISGEVRDDVTRLRAKFRGFTDYVKPPPAPSSDDAPKGSLYETKEPDVVLGERDELYRIMGKAGVTELRPTGITRKFVESNIASYKRFVSELEGVEITVSDSGLSALEAVSGGTPGGVGYVIVTILKHFASLGTTGPHEITRHLIMEELALTQHSMMIDQELVNLVRWRQEYDDETFGRYLERARETVHEAVVPLYRRIEREVEDGLADLDRMKRECVDDEAGFSRYLAEVCKRNKYVAIAYYERLRKEERKRL